MLDELCSPPDGGWEAGVPPPTGVDLLPAERREACDKHLHLTVSTPPDHQAR